MQSGGGSYKYASSGIEQTGKLDVFRRVFRDTVISVEEAVALVVVHTMPGSAGAAAEAIDEIKMVEIAGCLAGDNTIFVAPKNADKLTKVADALRAMIR